MATRLTRRSRVWATTEERTTALARSARHLARAAGNRLAVKAAADCFTKYQYVSAVERSAKLARGDLLVELIDVHGVRAIDIARRTGERPADLSEMVAVARAFPRDARQSNAIYNHLLLATRAIKRFPALGWTASEALVEILRSELTQHREVTRYFDSLVRKKLALPDARSVNRDATLGHRADHLDRAHHGRFQDLLPRFADRSIQILSIDPPYVFDRDGDTYAARSASERQCDNGDDPDAAIGVVTDLLQDWQPKLAAGGVVLLWQPWQSLLKPIADAIGEHRWAIEGPVIWDKGRTQPGRFDSPYSVQGEFLWVLHRPGDRLIDHEVGSSRGMIMRYSPASHPRTTKAQLHAYEKPVELNEHLVRKHSRLGDLVVDACGCTASMSVAASRNDRRWVYVESNANNFEIGSQRLRAFSAARTVPVDSPFARQQG